MEVAPLLEKINKNIEEFKNKQLENTQSLEINRTNYNFAQIYYQKVQINRDSP